MESGRPRPDVGLRKGSHRLTGRPFDQLRLNKGGPTPCDDLLGTFFHPTGVSLFAFGNTLVSEKQ